MHSKECEVNWTTILYSFKNTKNLNMLITSGDRGHYTISQEFHHDDTEVGLPAITDFFKTLLRYRTSKVFSSLHWEGILTQIPNHTSRKNKGTSKYDPKNVKNVIKVKFSFLR